jgi:hypothetical protein
MLTLFCELLFFFSTAQVMHFFFRQRERREGSGHRQRGTGSRNGVRGQKVREGGIENVVGERNRSIGEGGHVSQFPLHN